MLVILFTLQYKWFSTNFQHVKKLRDNEFKNQLLMQKYRSQIDYNPDMAAIIGRDGLIQEINNKIKEVLGEDTIGRHFTQVLFDFNQSHSQEISIDGNYVPSASVGGDMYGMKSGKGNTVF